MNDVISSMKLIRESRYIPAEAKREFDAVMPLVERFGKLGPNARRVLLALAERLVVGIPHGDFDKPHDWDKESSEEALDLAVYQAAKLLGLGKEAKNAAFLRAYDEAFKGLPYVRTADGQQVDADGRKPDGMPWVPRIGTRVRVVARSPKTTIDVGDVLTLACSWEFNETWAECRTIAGAAGFVRVVPA